MKSDFFKITSTKLSGLSFAKETPFIGKKTLPKNGVILVQSEFGGGFSRDALEDAGEIIGIGIAAGEADLPDAHAALQEHLLGFFHP